MSDKIFNWDEMIGFIMRKANENDINLFYSDVKAVLDAEKEFLKQGDFSHPANK